MARFKWIIIKNVIILAVLVLILVEIKHLFEHQTLNLFFVKFNQIDDITRWLCSAEYKNAIWWLISSLLIWLVVSIMVLPAIKKEIGDSRQDSEKMPPLLRLSLTGITGIILGLTPAIASGLSPELTANINYASYLYLICIGLYIFADISFAIMFSLGLMISFSVNVGFGIFVVYVISALMKVTIWRLLWGVQKRKYHKPGV